ncbi:4-(cytidine 5'-diphospho)-2-C-methyl-D-erythritol kinase [uncultured Megasphaera sp.]|jgi:4-diphosphocytidyl-2-C-methyl-D-erythritol kinase|uniref:4-(cytidine 5'-diphospho)-2-C-methyl-D-erythritol kinase n=1 Tax=uncultured Megasphaera sp. TaxID=165188 RepID=UPI0025DF1897|nr:4-(cytidine 5'-diphospho)-2-C-methyl-D-erythritol kinase [uncultured Megasphaera sp.]
MTKIVETGYGKINLALAITGRRSDGYHDIDTVFQSIGLCDTVTLREADEWQLTCSVPGLACDETNLAYKAWKALCPYKKDNHLVAIHIEKNIPIAAGLAGGSTDCAAVLRGLNRLWHLELSEKELCRIGAGLGADVPFCICGGTMRGTGIGEKLKRLPSLPAWPVVIVHPHVAVQTPKAYALFDRRSQTAPVAVDAVEQAVRASDFQGLMAAMGNTFEELVIPDVPQVADCQRRLTSLGLRPLMAGSGPTVFALIPPGREETVRSEAASWTDVDVYMTEIVKRVEGER